MKTLKEQLDYFYYVSKNPKIIMEKYLEEGYKVIGCFPYYNVHPIISALGMIPMGVWGANISPKYAGQYSPSFTCSLSRSCLELGMDGSLESLSAIVMPILCDTLRGQVTAWKEGVNDPKLIPFVPPQNRKDSGAIEYYIQEIKYVTRELEKISGNLIENKKLYDSLDLYNDRNKIVREFLEISNEHLDVITADVRHSVMKAITFLRPEEIIFELGLLIDLLKSKGKYFAKGKRVLASGILLDSDAILNAMKDSNINIVADDLANESRLYRFDYPMSSSAFESFARHWTSIKGCSLVHDDDAFARGKALVEYAKRSHADIVILFMMKFCDIEEYDEPYITKMLREEGLMVISIDIDQSSEEYGQAITKIQALSEI